MTKGPIPSTVRKVSVPIMIGFFFHTMFNVTDTFFAGKISTQALAGLSISFPLFFILIALGAGFGNGITALTGHELGKKNALGAAHIHVQGMILLTAIAVLLAVFGGPFLELGLLWIGAEGDYFTHAYNYISLLYRLGFCLLLTQGINAGLNALGKTSYFRNFLIGSFLLNLILDPVFMFGLFGFYRMETSGAALATASVNFLGILYLGHNLRKSGFWQGIRPRHLVPDPRIFYRILLQGVPSFLNMLLITVFFLAVNYFVAFYGVGAVAAFGIGLRMEQIALIPCIAVNMAVLSIVARNYGAGNYARVRETYRYALKLTMWVVFPLCVVVLIFREPLIGIFSKDPAVIEIGSTYLIFASLFTIANGLINVNHAVLQGLKTPHLAMFNGILRHMLLPIGLSYAVVAILQKPLFWIWAAMLLSALAGLGVSFALARFKMSQTLNQPA